MWQRDCGNALGEQQTEWALVAVMLLCELRTKPVDCTTRATRALLDPCSACTFRLDCTDLILSPSQACGQHLGSVSVFLFLPSLGSASAFLDFPSITFIELFLLIKNGQPHRWEMSSNSSTQHTMNKSCSFAFIPSHCSLCETCLFVQTS